MQMKSAFILYCKGKTGCCCYDDKETVIWKSCLTAAVALLTFSPITFYSLEFGGLV